MIEEKVNSLIKYSTPYQTFNSKKTFEYNSAGKLIATRYYDIKLTPNVYTDIVKSIYDSKGNEIKTEEYYINSLGSENLDRYNNKSYNTKNLLILNERFSVNSGKVNKYEYKYDTNNNLSEEKYYNVPVTSYRLVSNAAFSYKQFINNKDVENIKFSLSPNPVKDILQLNVPQQIDAVSIFSVDGKIRMTQNNPDKFIDLSNLESGVYLIQVYTKEGVGTKKIVKE